MKKYFGEMLIIALCTGIMGQIHFYPFGTDFRLTLGVVAFTFLILYFKVPIMATALLSSLFVLSLRTGLDVFSQTFTFDVSINRHLPALLFYLTYGLIIEQIEIRGYIQRPVLFVIIISLADICSNFLELFVRNNLGSYQLRSILTTIFMAAFIRAIMVTVMFWIIRYYNLLIVKEVHQKRYQELLLLTARLKSEVLFLKKSTQDIEDVMVKSYSIYSNSKLISAGNLETLPLITDHSLSLAIDIHEIKKDYLRIVHSIGKIIPTEELSQQMTLKEILKIIHDIFTEFSEATGKPMNLRVRHKQDVNITRYYEVISILNNLIHNALESTQGINEPTILVTADVLESILILKVKDNGCGVPKKDKDLIFEPGFTTRIDLDNGDLPTGLGLTHVKYLTEMLEGSIVLDEEVTEGATFVLKLPIRALTDKEVSL